MVGHPGETEQDFAELLDFVRDVKFERMGAFAYSEEEGTYSRASISQRRLTMTSGSTLCYASTSAGCGFWT